MQRDNLGFLMQLKRDYGDFARFRVGPYYAYLVAHPDDIHEILVTQAAKFYKSKVTKTTFNRFLGDGLLTSDGEFWKRQRRLEQPAFHVKRVTAYADTMVELTERQLERWGDGQQLDIDHEMMSLTLNIIARTMFDADVSGAANAVDEAMGAIQEIISQQNRSIVPPLPIWIPTPRNRREHDAVETLDSILNPIIAERRISRADKGDLLSMILLAQDEDGSSMTDKQVRDECMTLFLAGHETTANVLNWTWYLLAQNPEAEAKLHAELDAVLGGRNPTLADFPQLKYTEMVIKEAMRLYPPAWSTVREPIEDVTIRGYTIPKGTTVIVPFYLLHHDERWFPEPERFIPERFSPENEKQIPRYAYIPFGGGPRVCIGNQFAQMEARLLLATIAQRYQLALAPGQQVEKEPLITLRPKNGLRMTVKQREALVIA
jgi:cytochrome P450